ncbi:hypothetical protein [Sphingobium subterraneum]|uniref:S-adenosyl-L-homocysteine hydrolase n=1 Tax=Sphingobium subterraneum TaxID=627688 RepID=A0A841J3T2_9SPHN|nr:hypothetical protein [Sphingobium subterraneum]MBB6123178.1 hypothetical protein [Sphingobium subterraneum]
MKWIAKSAATVAALVGMMSAAPAMAASCWTDAAYRAAQIRDFETMMMVSTLRCRITGVDFSEPYNQFIRGKRQLLIAANETLRGQFAQTVGAARALGAYDDYMTKIANSYGGGMAGMNCRDFASVVDAAVASPATTEAVAQLAAMAGSAPRVPGDRCGVTVAMQAGK